MREVAPIYIALDTLTRLNREGKLMRVERRAYAAPVISRFGVRPPSIEAVVKAIESASGEVIVANGVIEANALGLTTQMPIRALSWLGSKQASSALKMLHTKLPPVEWAVMRSVRAVLPSWMARAVSEVSEHV